MATLTALSAGHGFTAGDLDASGQVAVCPAYQKVYFADGRPYSAILADSGYHKLDFINDRLVGDPDDDGAFTKGEVITQAGTGAAGIFDETVAVGAKVWNLIYRTTEIAFDTSEVEGADSGTTLTPTSIAYPPHWLNWTLTTQETGGPFPEGGSNILALCFGRIFMNSVSSPHQWFATRINDPLDLLLVADDVASAVNSQVTERAGLVGDPIVAIISYKDNFAIFGGQNKMFVLRSDPAKGGFFSILSDTTGIFSNTSFCWDDKNNLYFLGNDGFYALSTEAIINALPPTNITKDTNPKLISSLGLNRRTDRVAMAFDKDRYGIEVSVSQLDGQWSVHFWIDLRTGGVFPESYQLGHIPASLFYFDSHRKDQRGLLAGGYDGYIRKWDEATKSDTNSDDALSAINSYALIGPLATGDQICSKIELSELSIKTGIDTDQLTVAIYSAITSAELIRKVNAGETPAISKQFTVDKLLPSIRARVADGAVGIMLSNNTVDTSFGIEEISANIQEVGRIK